MARRRNEATQQREPLPLASGDAEELRRLRVPGPERAALEDLSGTQLDGEVTESALLHAVLAVGLRAVREAAEARAYAEAAFERRAASTEDRAIARPGRPS